MALYGTMNSAGHWADVSEERLPYIFTAILTREPIIAARHKRRALTSIADIEIYLETHDDLQYGDEWYEQLRRKNMQTPPQRLQPLLVSCDCGHQVLVSAVMHASLGTSCPGCYDRLSA